MEYLIIKVLHVISATFLVGVGAGSAYYLWRTLRRGDPRLIAGVAALAVQADWLFTLPAGIIQLVSGLWLVHAGGHAWGGWVGVSLALFLLAGLCWLPAAWLQGRMRDEALASLRSGRMLSDRHQTRGRIWFWLGVPAFTAMLVIYALMVIKPGW
jgi:uncharacterized membrane protein